MKKRILSLALASAMAVGTVSGAFAETETPEVLNGPQYIKGNESKEFMPNSKITRQEIAVMVGRALELEGSNPDFKDADKIAAWADEFVAGLQDAEIVKGDEKGNFNPTNKITRAELAAMVVRAYENATGEELSEGDTSFDDVADSAWYAKEVKKAAEAGLVLGDGEGSFNPMGEATRAETVMMINRMLGLGEGNLPSDVAELLETSLVDKAQWPSWAVDAILIASSAYEYTVGEDGKITIVEDEEPTVELKVESVSAINHQSVLVKFNQELESVDKADFTINNGVTVLEAKFGADKKSVYLTTTSQNQGTEYTLSYKGEVSGTFTGTTGQFNSKITVSTTDSEVKQTSTPTATNDANINRGKRTYTINVKDLNGKVDLALIQGGNYNATTGEFTDVDDNMRADFGAVTSVIEEVNGSPQAAGTNFVNNVEIPANGVITVTVDNTTGAENVRLVAFQDTNADNQLTVDANGIAKEEVGIGGRTGYYVAKAAFGASNPNTAGGFVFTDIDSFVDGAGNLYSYDANDKYQVGGVEITKDQFEQIINAGDVLAVSYNTSADGVSTFNITTETGFEAPAAAPTVNVRNLDSGATMNDVRVDFLRGVHANGTLNPTSTVYTVQRASTLGPDGIDGTIDDIAAGDEQWVTVGTVAGTETLRYDDKNLSDGAYVYRIVVKNPVTGVESRTARSAKIVLPANPDTVAPLAIQTTMKDAGNPNELDSGDKVQMLFNEEMKLEAGDIVRLQDAEGEYSNVVLGTGNTFTATTVGDQTLLTITFTAKASVDGGKTFATDGVIQTAALTWTAQTGVTDLAGNDVNLAGSDTAVNVDIVRPTAAVQTIGVVGGTSFVIRFNEPIDRADAAKIANYTVTNGGGLNNPVIAVEVSDVNPRAYTDVTVYTRDALNAGAVLAQTVADLAGNEGNQTGLAISPAVAAPTITLNVAPANNTVFPVSTVTFEGTANANAGVSGVQVRIDGGAWVNSGTNGVTVTTDDGAFDETSEDFDATIAGLSQGVHTFEFRTVENGGAVSAASAVRTVYVSSVASGAPAIDALATQSAAWQDGAINAAEDNAALNMNVTLPADAAPGDVLQVRDGGNIVIGTHTVAAGEEGTSVAVSISAANLQTLTGADAVSNITARVLRGTNNALASADSAAVSIYFGSTAPTATITNAVYNDAANTITLTGADFNTLYDGAGQVLGVTDIKGQLDATKVSFVDSQAQLVPAFNAASIKSAVAQNNTTLVITLTDAYAAQFENVILATDGLVAADTLAIAAGFTSDSAGNLSAGDNLAADGLDV
ncbi:endoglucanase precursor [Andreesenia angusta]|uniref:Endoglucanase n=1 Tax=Andreesenia angusta TaxID=39480 RepID=A0A1S1V5D4_9FIRM|nr:S-layer homology domain-containing protein [Andreesenia angusta]OHW61861.1 endoglucanase precursor [Andreesenia angusta]